MLNRRTFLTAACACCGGLAAAPLAVRAAGAAPSDEGLPQALELGDTPMTRLAKTVWVRRLASGLWLHATTNLIAAGFYYPANGLILERRGGSLMIDTGYAPEQAEVLLDWSRRNLQSPISLAVATHFHNDRTGGIPDLQKHGVRTLAYPLTCDLARAAGQPVPEPIEGWTTGAHRLGADCELYFPGAGHTRDNVVAWMPRQRVLFGGCLIKSITSKGMGNTADAVMGDYAATVRGVQARYPRAKAVVPGHGTISGDPIGHTLALLAQAGEGHPP